MSDSAPGSFAELIKAVTPELHGEMRKAIELGRWANGDRLTDAQRENTLQLVIAWEAQNLPEEERVGYIDRTNLRKTLCDDQ